MKDEDALQINVINWFNYNYPMYENDLHHFANERKCSPIEGRKLKRMGVKRGVSDLFLAVPNANYYGFWLELKTPTGKASKEQLAFTGRKNAMGYLALIAYGEDEAQRYLTAYMSKVKQVHQQPTVS